MSSFSRAWTQFHPPKPTYTEKNIPDLHGKVYIVTGANTGIGKEVARILYTKHAKVYAAGRSPDKTARAIEDIKKSAPESKGALVFLQLDLADLSGIKASVGRFLAQETKLHVLFNNAGLMGSDPLRKTAQGYELTLGVNCVGTFLFTKLLTPVLAATAKTEPPAAVRVVWLSSYGLESYGVPDVGVPLDNLDYHEPKAYIDRYGISKAGVWALGAEFARRHKADGIVSVPINPGNLRTELARDATKALRFIAGLVVYPVVNGAYTELFAGLSPEITMEKTGSWIIPFGRFYPLRPDLEKATKLEAEGGTGGNYKFWEWNEDQVKSYL
ncbi:putative short-chain dehydrogenase protein [Phaeoacremonium minimum UCRPA7]|uniref:Putative short-chain dehydrogenase protein n=1 Tax=Phaeoacremonium minimum (strain UCR-PA7) TaxID=1286976 RepID=R8BPR7_PHAM7|nr:putative short-chain dehydrogenase protein [Phaeoacremonium minimum UCRPA7]EOO01358.1 putative short-chain dehydrogenase protein [Phaeoacremonium minimum UCRPA7]